MENRIKVAIQGFEGCFHQTAAYALLGENIEIKGCSNFRELTQMVESGEADKGVMAIENSIAGSILPNYALLQNYSLKITGEIHMRIHQHLLAIKGTKIEDIREVQSHPMALLQCGDFLSTLNNVRLLESRDTGYSAQVVSQEKDCTQAAIAGELAAELYGLEIIKKDIHSVENNYTRFLLIDREDTAKPVIGSNKASIYFKIAHERGSLTSVLKCFEKLNVNMTKLQSNPIPTDPFRYLFHTDMEFDHLEEFLSALDAARKVTEELNICGIYKKGVFVE
ncbi:MAG: prephenate dehydratase [Rikenellaceae bacterium]